MNPDAVLVQVPSVDFRTLIGLTHKVMGRSPAAAADASRRELSDAEKFLTALRRCAMRRPAPGCRRTCCPMFRSAPSSGRTTGTCSTSSNAARGCRL